MAARVISESIKTSLGPKGMDKMLVDSFGDITVTNDGATVLDEMDVQHPVAKMLKELAKTQDDEVGDGTTSAVVLASELLNRAESLLDKDVHQTVIVDGYKQATEEAIRYLNSLAIKVKPDDKDTLRRVASVAISGKMLAEEGDFIAGLAVDAALHVVEKTTKGLKVDLDNIKVEKKAGQSIRDTQLVTGVLLDKEVVHPGMPKRVDNAKIAILNSALEIEKTEYDSKISIEAPEKMKAFMDEEEKMLNEMVEKIEKAAANVVICQKGIDDMAQHFLAKKGIMTCRRVRVSDMEKLAKATGGRIITNLDAISKADLGYAKLVEERRVGEDKMTFVEGCKDPRAVTILIRGGTQRIVDEAERSLHDALCVIRDVVGDPRIVAGGGSAEVEIARRLRKYADKLSGKEQLAVLAFSEALESIPMILAENAGLDPIDILVAVRAAHDRGKMWVGVDPMKGGTADLAKLKVYEPLAVKTQIIRSASEAACMILKIDDVIAAGKSKEPDLKPPKGPTGLEEEGAGENY